MKKLKLQNILLFEGENEINHKNFCYDYSEELSRMRTTDLKCYMSFSGKSKLDKWESIDSIDFNCNIIEKIPESNPHYYDIRKEELKLLCSLKELQSDLNIVAKNNFNDFLNDKTEQRQNKISMLWIHNYKTIFSTNYTDTERIKKSMKFINDL